MGAAPSNEEPESAGPEFVAWLDRQDFDAIERRFDGEGWNPKVGPKYPAVRDWLQRERQSQRRDRGRKERYSDIIARAIAITSLMISAVSMWVSLRK